MALPNNKNQLDNANLLDISLLYIADFEFLIIKISKKYFVSYHYKSTATIPLILPLRSC